MLKVNNIYAKNRNKSSKKSVELKKKVSYFQIQDFQSMYLRMGNLEVIKSIKIEEKP